MNGDAFALEPIELDDLRDPRLAPYLDVRDADLRGAHGLYLVESEACIERWLAGMAQRRRAPRPAPTPALVASREPFESPMPPPLEAHSLLLTREAFERLRPAIADAIAPADDRGGDGARTVPPIFVAPVDRIDRLSGYDHHHGALALGRRRPDGGVDALRASLGVGGRAGIDAATPDPGRASARGADGALLLATDGVVHVDNMGSLFRNAAAFGAAGVLCSSDSADPLVRKTVRISMGHVFTVPWAVERDLDAALERLRDAGFRVLAAEDEPGAVDLADHRWSDRTVVVFGAEGRGVRRSILERADAVVRIRTRPGAPLNVAVASAIVLHEAIRSDRRGGAARA